MEHGSESSSGYGKSGPDETDPNSSGPIMNPHLVLLLSLKRSGRDAFQQLQPKYQILKRDGIFTRKSLATIEDYPSYAADCPWEIKLVHLDEFRTNMFLTTFQFILAGRTIERLYEEFKKGLDTFYTHWNNTNFGLIPEDNLESEKYKYAVLYIDESETYARVRISYPTVTKVKGPIQPILLQLIDHGTTLFLNLDEHKLFYLHKDFIEPVRRSNVFTLDRTLPFIKFSREFRLVSGDLLKENQIYTAHLKRIVKRIAVLDLIAPNYATTTVNELLIKKTIETFENPQLPKVGKVFRDCYFEHIEANGRAYIQYKNTLQFSIFETFQNSIKESFMFLHDFDTHFEIKENERYLVKWEDWFYRCEILPNVEVEPDEVHVFFIDYGDQSNVKKRDLVPCALADREFNSFPPQAVIGQLNMKDLDLDKLYERYGPTNVTIMTLAEATAETNNLPIIELFVPRLENPAEVKPMEKDKEDKLERVDSSNVPEPRVAPASKKTSPAPDEKIPITQDMVDSGFATKLKVEISVPSNVVKVVGEFKLN